MYGIKLTFPYTQKEALEVFENNPHEFRTDLLSSLKEESGLFFETYFTDQEDPFIVLLYNTEQFIDHTTDSSIYTEKLQSCDSKESSISFISPNTKTHLVIPCSIEKDYGRFLKFLLHSSEDEWKELWKEIASIIRQKKRVKLWTHGLSVPWLHFRVADFRF